MSEKVPDYIFRSLNETERKFHLNMKGSGLLNGVLVTFPVSGLFPSGEALFYDHLQNIEHPKYGTPLSPKVFAGYNYSWKQPSGVNAFLQPSGTDVYLELNPIVGISGLKPYSSGDVTTRFISNTAHPSGGTGELDKLPYDFSFNTDDFLVRNSG